MTGELPPPRVRHRWRLFLRAADLDACGQTLTDAVRRGTSGMEPGLDVVLEVSGRVGYCYGAGRIVGQALSDARTIDVLAGGPGAAAFVEEVQEAAERYLEPWLSGT